MKREYGIPFLLWICAAIVAHLMWTAGADRVARVVEDLTKIRWFAETVRTELAQGEPTEVEIELLPQPPGEEPEEAKATPPKPEAPPKAKPDPVPEATPAEREAAKPEQPKPEAPIILFPSPKPAAPPPPPPPPIAQPPKDQRIAVKQHVENKSQDDNPTARFVGDEANHVEEESVARITGHDQDDPNPTPGGQHSAAEKNPGNANETKIGESEDREGDPERAPGEHVAASKPGAAERPPAAPPPPSPGKPDAPRVAKAEPRAPSRPTPPNPVAPPPEPAAGVDAVASDKGSYSLDPRRKRRPAPADSAHASRFAPPTPSRIGLGAAPNANGVQTNLTMNDVVATVGADELARHRAADGERRRSEHRGSWNSSSFERWRGAIENYVSSVRPGNQTALNTARVPFATYLVSIHNRLHPVFADTFLASLDALPFDHPLNDYKVMATLEIVVDPNEGRVKKLGVIKTSGLTGFDVGALDAVYRSAPFGKAPPGIISSDGNVYLHWEFHRNPIYACSTMNARPYILNNVPPIEEPKGPPREPAPPSDPRERGVPPGGAPSGSERTRYGLVVPPRQSPPRG